MVRCCVGVMFAFVVCAMAGCKRKDSAEPPAPGKAAPAGARVPQRPAMPSTPGSDALARKARSEARLKSEGVVVNETLPVIASEAEAKIRSKEAVVERAIGLMIVAVKGEGLEQDRVDWVVKRYGAGKMLSPAEQRFIAERAPTQRDRVQFAWRYEGLAVLLWALGLEVELVRPANIVDAGKIVDVISRRTLAELRADAKPRTASELLDEADLIYRYDWACVDARAGGKPAPASIDCEIVVERHHALNWLIGYMGQDWDDVSTDT